MCLVIDTSTIAMVFDPTNKRHSDFRPVFQWLNSSGRVIFGGHKYVAELAKMQRYVRIVNELARAGKVVKLDNTEVDRIAAELKVKVPDPNFDDEHIIAIVIVSRCKLICSDDQRAYPYFRRKDLYPKGLRRPRIYRHHMHATLCCKQNIVSICT